MIEIKDLTFEYTRDHEKKRALNNINIKINDGEFVALIGHNGSGKTTLAKLLNGILKPKQGDILINGMNTRDTEKLWAIRQSAGMVFQNPDNQLVATIVEEDVAFGPENLGVPSDEIIKRVDEALKTVEMSAFKKQKPHQLSGGQKQRIAIAGILAMHPKCIILDEPTAMLDPEGRREVMDTIYKLNKEEGMTVLHITHYMNEIINADRVYVLDGGELVLQGTPREVFSQVEKLKKIGLDVPQMTELGYDLKNKGYDIPETILTVEEMVGALCQLKLSI
jgi:energy-coupling factor transport system ATP-binding protein